jgi:hypothetical protein
MSSGQSAEHQTLDRTVGAIMKHVRRLVIVAVTTATLGLVGGAAHAGPADWSWITSPKPPVGSSK